MTSPQCLPFLRPYAFRPLITPNTAYLRFYELARQHGNLLTRGVKTSVGDKKNRQPPKDSRGKPATTKGHGKEQAAEKYEPQNNSAFIAQRIKELSEADALSWPRVQHRAVAIHISRFKNRIPKQVVEDASQAAAREKASGNENKISEETTEDFLATYAVYGRLRSVRRSGAKLMFLDLVNGFDDLQGMVDLSKLQDGTTPEQFKAFSHLIKKGDHVSVVGRPGRNNKGEKHIEITQLPQLLSPSLVPLPFKLTDEETKMQHRHMDMLVNAGTLETLRLRSMIVNKLREHVTALGCLEFQTPILAGNAGGAIARSFTTHATEFPQKELALRIAPELWLKRLVAGGLTRVFEIGPSFRNEGLDATHNPEFTMCEYYIAYATLDDLITNTTKFMYNLSLFASTMWLRELKSEPPAINYKKFRGPYKQVEFIPALEEALGFKLPDLTSDTALGELLALLESNKKDYHKDVATSSLPKLLDRLAAKCLEPASFTEPIYITHHPACMSPLSKSFTCPKTNQLVSARAELFVDGREIANMYEEENDPFTQRRKFVEQAKYRDQRLAAGDETVVDDEDPPHVIDESYISVLESGLPPTGGWGCGVDRLVMLFTGAKRISDVLPFGNLRNVVGLSTVNPVKQ